MLSINLNKLLKDVIGIALVFTSAHIYSQSETEPEVFDYAEDNQVCFNCHGQATYFFYNENIGREIRDRMNPYFIIDSAKFYRSNHRHFACTDCHSYDYNNFPHSGELRMEESYNCIDCHGGDETWAEYNFERIDEEFRASVHSTKHSDDFTCWMCHNPHEYKITARTNENLKETIVYDNEICMSCHTDINKYQLISYKENPNVIDQHEWLPNQAVHFLNVRCIECHAETKEDMMVAHNVQPKEKAVKKCVECHSQNSILMASLYKFQSQEQRSKLGFINAAVLNNSYIIGANRNIYLNIISLIIFGLVLGGIGIHAFLRIVKK